MARQTSTPAPHVSTPGFIDVYCPVTDHYEELQYLGDLGPSEPQCTGCFQLVAPEDLVSSAVAA